MVLFCMSWCLYHMSRCVVLCFFFFKQKTAYEMRISDWSSDVCSSDLLVARLRVAADPLSLLAHLEAAEGRQLHHLAADKCIRHLEIGRASCRERVCQYV